MKKIMILAVMVAAFVLPTMAQFEQEWQNATLQGSGSAYSSQVTPIGATSAASEATTTTESYSPGAPGSIRRDKIGGADAGQSNESPVGDAVVPLLLIALSYAGVTYIRKRKNAHA